MSTSEATWNTLDTLMLVQAVYRNGFIDWNVIAKRVLGRSSNTNSTSPPTMASPTTGYFDTRPQLDKNPATLERVFNEAFKEFVHRTEYFKYTNNNPNNNNNNSSLDGLSINSLNGIQSTSSDASADSSTDTNTSTANTSSTSTSGGAEHLTDLHSCLRAFAQYLVYQRISQLESQIASKDRQIIHLYTQLINQSSSISDTLSITDGSDVSNGTKVLLNELKALISKYPILLCIHVGVIAEDPSSTGDRSTIQGNDVMHDNSSVQDESVMQDESVVHDSTAATQLSNDHSMGISKQPLTMTRIVELLRNGLIGGWDDLRLALKHLLCNAMLSKCCPWDRDQLKCLYDGVERVCSEWGN